MPSQGPNTPANAINVPVIGSVVSWSDVDETRVQDNSVGTLATGTPADNLLLTGLGFSIPGGEPITYVTVTVRAKDSIGGGPQVSAKLAVSGVGVGTENTVAAPVATLADYSIGGTPSGFWGYSLTAADVNASDFGVLIMTSGIGVTNDVGIDAVWITVEYGTPLATRVVKARRYI